MAQYGIVAAIPYPIIGDKPEGLRYEHSNGAKHFTTLKHH